ncbi:MAG: ABC-type transport auxiliary lipoprotein family protein [Victivallaceae bacterium]|jgi:ABC-type uncharacterized transport system auxiliary subunit
MSRFIFGLLTVFLAGCSIFPKPDGTAVSYFDIQPSPAITQAGAVPKIMILPFQAGSAYGTRMVFKVNEHQVKFDEFNRWAAPPDEMVRALLATYFSGNREQGGSPELTLEGDIITFRCNLPDHTVTVTISVICREYPSQRIVWREVFTRNVKIEQDTAGAFAGAASKGTIEIAEAIRGRLTAAR